MRPQRRLTRPPRPQPHGRWPKHPGPILDWLMGEARQLPDSGAILRELCKRLVDAGVPLRRTSFHIRTLHPQLFAAGFYWQRDSEDVRVSQAQHGVQETALFLSSPMRTLFEGAGAVRQRLDLQDSAFPYPLFYQLRDEGLTDYVALPMTFSDGKIHGTTWSSDRPGGFESAHIAQIEDLLPAYSLLLEIHLNRRIAINILDTYVETEQACARAVQAAVEARRAMAGLNEELRAGGQEPLGFGIALHVGEVMYGNIGAVGRLDFTVIGRAVNLAARMQALCRVLGPTVLVSDTFVQRCSGVASCSGAFRSLGEHQLVGIARPVELFTLPEAPP